MIAALRLLLVVLIVGLGACATPEHALKHKNLREGGTQILPKKVLFIAPDIRVKEVSAGGVVEEVPDWSARGRNHIRASFATIARELDLVAIDPPSLTPELQEVLDQHVALYDLVAGNAFDAADGFYSAWAHKRQAFDYTLGPGLAFLRGQTGADAALFIVGTDSNTTTERKVAIVVGALFGVSISGGVSHLTAGVVDLASGDLLWLSYELDQTTDLRDAKDADKLLRKVFASYPGAPSGLAR